MLQELEIKASELISIEITDANVRKYKFPQNASKIEKGRVVAFQSYYNGDISLTPEGANVVNFGTFRGSFLTLKDKENDANNLEQVPLQDLRRSGNSGIYERISPLRVDFSQSEVEIGEGVPITQGEFFLFRILYIPDKDCK